MFERMRFPIWLIFIIFPFSKWRILCHHMKYPSPPNQRYRYVHFSFSPIWFCVNFHCFLFFQDGGSYGLFGLWNTPLPPYPVFLIWFDVIRMPRKADSHASHVWLAWLARLTRLPRMPRMVGSHASHASLARTLYKLVQFHQRGTKVPPTYCFTNRQHPLVIS